MTPAGLEHVDLLGLGDHVDRPPELLALRLVVHLQVEEISSKSVLKLQGVPKHLIPPFFFPLSVYYWTPPDFSKCLLFF